MKSSYILGAVLAAASANASFLDPIRDFFSPNQEVIQIVGEAEQFSNVFSQEVSEMGTQGLDILKVWEKMTNEMGRDAVERAKEAYETAKNLKQSNLKNKKTHDAAGFEVQSDPKHPGYALRAKKTNPELLGLDSVDQYTGYLDVEELKKHFFYWFFESRNDPKNDPVILWLNGGPGCSSATGLFFELGPSSINATLQPTFNPYSWNNNASVIFLDQPVGVGYSYTEGEDIGSTAAAAKDVYIFLELFFQKFPQFVKNDFHISGESYAGHYIPAFATEILNNADRSFNLTSVLIGNGITDPLIQYKYYRPMMCGEGGYKPVLTTDKCEQMDRQYPGCAALTQACYAFQSAFTCVPAGVYCSRIMQPYQETGLNPYDIRKKCESGGICYVEMDYVEEYLNLDFVRDAIGAETESFVGCDPSVMQNFILTGDHQKPFQQHVAELLEQDIPVLLYEGDKDVICNWLGNQAWSNALEYSKHDLFEAQPLRPWRTRDGELAGEVKNYDKFTFVRVYDAGHMVPFDQPANALDLVNRWIQGDYSYGK
ncbi:hypothetical protein FT663_02998 [Candidozyma haemuli var. vulneris]|uniref:Carboxypeptidase n=1 Tax=Candidozyma haemuli TaxID=45357 RepID=A0A2V1B0T7_9ASCO|nr:hypothetical protein CXQ85_004081 [[Candida] haemuloni]KAF3989064.1 hypothetical protein FT662_03038 [[Candida] haemuloni var. vulneris]KAF3990834.1 hypothetical protein FT663_02998 [[Candida] haemuloni var. vulneris]PVH23788.1 hypothetical protein CXQ85_004081 [[Candida] haemuloni]